MVRLITLKLQPVSRLVNQPPLSPTPSPPPPIPAKSPGSTESKMPFALPLPRTQNQWRIALDEIRATYLRREYKQCSVRCIQLLEGAPDTLHTLHRIYLSFYAAICLELLARPLPIYSPEKFPLFNLARVYYQKAEQYMCEAESGHFSHTDLVRTSLEVHRRFPSSSSNSSATSRVSSISSRPDSPSSFSSSSPMRSPASSLCSSFSKSEEESSDTLKPQPLRVKKTVSFHLNSATVVSPAGIGSASTSAAASEVFQSRLDQNSSSPSPTVGCISSLTHPTTTTTINNAATQSTLPISQSQSLTRYGSIRLTPLKKQLAHHLSTITALISALQTTPPPPPSQPLSSPPPPLPPSSPHLSPSFSAHKPDLRSRTRIKRGNLPTAFDSYKTALSDIVESEATSSTTAMERIEEQAAEQAQVAEKEEKWEEQWEEDREEKWEQKREEKRQEKQEESQEEKQAEEGNWRQNRAAKLASLKQRGAEWRLGRGRFDGSRYERLCQDALRELRARIELN